MDEKYGVELEKHTVKKESYEKVVGHEEPKKEGEQGKPIVEKCVRYGVYPQGQDSAVIYATTEKQAYLLAESREKNGQ